MAVRRSCRVILTGVLGAAVVSCGSGEGAMAVQADGAEARPTPLSTVAVAAPVATVAAAIEPEPLRKRHYPLTVRVEREPTAIQDRVARTALAPMFQKFAELLETRQVNYAVAMIDLNDDGRDDLIAHIQDGQFCGQWGCQAYGVLATPTGFAGAGFQLGVCFNATITVRSTTTKGMRDLEFDQSGDTTSWNGLNYEGGCLD